MSLSDEDKQWMERQLGLFGANIEAKVVSLNRQIEERLGSLEERLGSLEEKVKSLDAKIDEKVGELDAKIERVETSLLTAFHQWASPLETRVRSHSLALRAFDQENENSIERDRKMAGL